MTRRFRDRSSHEPVARGFSADSHKAQRKAADGEHGSALEDFDFAVDFKSPRKRIDAYAKEKEKKDYHSATPSSDVAAIVTLIVPERRAIRRLRGVRLPFAALMGSCTFPWLVARGNDSGIGIARVLFNEAGDPAGVERRCYP
jgi:hypothetical protein